MSMLSVQPGSTPARSEESLPVRRNGRPRLRGFHRWAGGLVSVFVLLLSVTGIILHHPSLGGDPLGLPAALAVDPQNGSRVLKATPSGLFASDDGGATWEEIPADATGAVDVAFAPDRPGRVYAALRDFGLIRSEDGGRVWEQVPLPFLPAAEGISILRVSAGPAERATLITSAGVLVTRDAGKSWRWTERHGQTLGSFVHQIHTGYFFGRYAFYLYDLSAIALIGLTITGLIIWGRKNGRSVQGG